MTQVRVMEIDDRFKNQIQRSTRHNLEDWLKALKRILRTPWGSLIREDALQRVEEGQRVELSCAQMYWYTGEPPLVVNVDRHCGTTKLTISLRAKSIIWTLDGSRVICCLSDFDLPADNECGHLATPLAAARL